MLATFSLHKITGDTTLGFHPDDYSSFKFGNDAIAKKFGDGLADGFIKEVLSPDHPKGQLVVVSSPYSFIPTATFAMKNHFVFRLNRWLAGNHLPVLQETKVHRKITYKEDYGELDAEERMRLIGNDSFHIDKAFLQGKTILFLDDIKITGSHERMIMKMAETFDLANDIYLLYFAELINKDIHPSIENFLNYHAVKSIFDLERIIRGGSFFINTRIVKYILHYNFDAFRIFIGNQSDEFVNLLCDNALGNGYHNIEAYAHNLSYIKELLFSTHKQIKYGD